MRRVTAARTGTKFWFAWLLAAGLALLCAAITTSFPQSRAAANPAFAPSPVVRGLPGGAAEDPEVKTLCRAPSRERVRDGRPILISLPPAPAFTVGEIPPEAWRKPPVSDPGWLLGFQSLMWMPPLAHRAAQDGQFKSLTALVRQTALFHVVNPDPGSNQFGWDEGTALRRLQAENCLYALTRSAALIPGMTADVKVLTGGRYAGPPRLPVHNHGLMSNIHIVNAGKLLGRPEWISVAAHRLVTEAPQAFSADGVSFEQSSYYQNVNVGQWDKAGEILAGIPEYAEAGTKIRTMAQMAKRVYGFMTEPDGNIVQVGDSDLVKGQPGRPGDGKVLHDDETGWVIGRTSWTDPKAIYYTVRYGPERQAHGQENRAGGVTWSALGTRVLVGTGRYGYDLKDPLANYRRNPCSQNVAAPPDPKLPKGRTSTIAASFGPAAHGLTVTDDVYGVPHHRKVTVQQHQADLAVTDSFIGVPQWSQNWHLDPSWRLVAGHVGDANLTFEHPSGRRLTVSTSGRVAGMWMGDKTTPYGWVFPAGGKKTAAYQFSVVSAEGAPVATSFQVS